MIEKARASATKEKPRCEVIGFARVGGRLKRLFIKTFHSGTHVDYASRGEYLAAEDRRLDREMRIRARPHFEHRLLWHRGKLGHCAHVGNADVPPRTRIRAIVACPVGQRRLRNGMGGIRSDQFLHERLESGGSRDSPPAEKLTAAIEKSYGLSRGRIVCPTNSAV